MNSTRPTTVLKLKLSPQVAFTFFTFKNFKGAPNLQTLNDYDDYYGGVAANDYSISEDEVLEERDPAFLDCKVSLFSKTYLRGENFSLDITNTDMNETLAIKDLSEGNK